MVNKQFAHSHKSWKWKSVQIQSLSVLGYENDANLISVSYKPQCIETERAKFM